MQREEYEPGFARAKRQVAALGKGEVQGYQFCMSRAVFLILIVLSLGLAPFQVAVHAADMSFGQVQPNTPAETQMWPTAVHDHAAGDGGVGRAKDRASHQSGCPTSTGSCCALVCTGLTAASMIPVAELAAEAHDLPPSVVARGLSLPVSDPPPKSLSR